MKILQHRALLTAAVVVIVAFLSAVLGSLTARQSIDEYVATLQELPYAGNVLSSRRPLAVPGTYSEAVGAIKERVSPSVVR